MLTSNNYLGLANHPRVREAAIKAIEQWGAGMGSVRFICGTQTLHKELEATISEFYDTEDTILYSSCWNANEAIFATLLGGYDAIVSDELNHASIIDGIRLCQGRAVRLPHNDLGDLGAKLARPARRAPASSWSITDGVFSMEGELAPLADIVSICERYEAVLIVDDSHGTGVLGRRGRGTAEELGVWGKVPIHTGTLGKAMGSAMGGYVTGPQVVVDVLRQRSRPYLFSNSLAPAVVGAATEAFRMVMEDPSRSLKVQGNARYFRDRDDRGRLPHPGRRAPDRAGHRRRHRPGPGHGQGPAGARRLRLRLRLPGGAPGPRPPAGPDLRRPQPEDLDRAADAFVAVAHAHHVL